VEIPTNEVGTLAKLVIRKGIVFQQQWQAVSDIDTTHLLVAGSSKTLDEVICALFVLFLA